MQATAAILLAACLYASSSDATAPRPNILWITCEDTGPHLGCYGDPDARTPSLDRLASRGTIYLRAWSIAPVCAPARTAIISGLYPASTGSEHMALRSDATLACMPMCGVFRHSWLNRLSHWKRGTTPTRRSADWSISQISKSCF
jgi:hypothetical protein